MNQRRRLLQVLFIVSCSVRFCISIQEEGIGRPEDDILRTNDFPEAESQTTSPYPQNLSAFISSLFGVRPSRRVTTTPSYELEENGEENSVFSVPLHLPDSSDQHQSSKKSRSAIANPFNISFYENSLDYYIAYAKINLTVDQLFPFIDSMSDIMRSEGKFFKDENVLKFGDLLTYAYRSFGNNLMDGNASSSVNMNFWSKKTERKNIKRYLKYVLSVSPEKITPRIHRRFSTGCENWQANFYFLSKELFVSLVQHNETEGYEILLEVLKLRNATLSDEQLQDFQCLYYNSYGGMRSGKSYVFSQFQEEWNQRNRIFSTDILQTSVRSIVNNAIQRGAPSTSRSTLAADILRIMAPFSDDQLAESDQTRQTRKPLVHFHTVIDRLEGLFAGIRKTDHFIEVSSNDIILATVLDAIMANVSLTERFSNGNSSTRCVLFSSENRKDWMALQALRLAGQEKFAAYDSVFKPAISKRVADVYNSTRRFRRLFSHAMRFVRSLPTGPLILHGCETLESLMIDYPPSDYSTNQARIRNFHQLLQFLRGMYSTSDQQVHQLPEQVQILTEPGVNKLLKLMVILPGDTTDDENHFAELGIRKTDSGTELVAIPIIAEKDDEDFTNVTTLWQIHLGYAKASFESFVEPAIKMKIMLSDDVNGELGLDKDLQEMVYKRSFDEADGFWDLEMQEGNMSFQLIHHELIENYFYIQNQNVGGKKTRQSVIKIKSKHFMMHQVPSSFKPAKFFVVPADT